MTQPATFDFTWVRGTTSPLVMTFQKNGVAIPFDDIRLSVFAGKQLAFRCSIVDTPVQMVVTDAPNGTVTFTPTAAQTRSLLPTLPDEDGKNKYEVELRKDASEEVYLMGTIAAIGGLNDDETGAT